MIAKFLGESHNMTFELLLAIILLPATSAFTEIFFSALKRIKSFVRSFSSQNRLNNLSIISIEKEFLRELHFF